jgi:hypothetical protein
MVPARALAQDATQQIPAVEVHPVGTSRDDPNGGQWFVMTLSPGETKQLQVRLYNAAEVGQTVKLYLADIHFDSHGIPEVENESTDVGKWGRFDEMEVSVPAKQSVLEALPIQAPENADPGDHIGAVVAEQSPQGSGPIQTIKRIATRLYVTLPGDARKDFVVDKVQVSKDRSFFTRELTTTVWLRNTGRVRLEPTVRVNKDAARGPSLLLAQSANRYVATEHVGFFGGPVRLHIDAQTRSLGLAGPVRQMSVTTWVIPWHLFVILALLAGLVFALRKIFSGRRGRYDSIRSDMRRLERMLSQQHAGDDAQRQDDPHAAILAAIKQARRAGDEKTAERLESRLTDAS